MTSPFLPDGVLIHGDTCLVASDTDDHREMLHEAALDDRYPFSYLERGYRRHGNLYIPQGGALAAKLQMVVTVLGPLRLEAGIPFSIPSGGAYDPVWGINNERVTHRKSDTSQHQYGPTRGAFGTALDFRPADFDDRWHWYRDWLYEQEPKVSVGIYLGNRGRFIHADLRSPPPWRSTMHPKVL